MSAEFLRYSVAKALFLLFRQLDESGVEDGFNLLRFRLDSMKYDPDGIPDLE